jgi:GAF domain-containing protein
LDAPFFIDSELKGVLCCEHCTPRQWSSEDIILVTSMAEIVSLVFRLDISRRNEAKMTTLADEVERLKQNRNR